MKYRLDPDGELWLKDVSYMQAEAIKGCFKFDRRRQMWHAPATIEALRRLRTCTPKLPEALEKRYNDILNLDITLEKIRSGETPLDGMEFPIKKKFKLFEHQKRAAAMALLIFNHDLTK